MPDRSRIRWSQLKVGLVAVAAMVILAVLIFLLTSSGGVLQHWVTLRMYVDDAAGTSTKAPVRLNGILIGYVDNIRLSGSRRPNESVEFDLSIQQKYLKEIPNDSQGTITAASLLGDKYINITRGTSRQPIQPGGVLRSVPPQDIPELMAQSANVLATLQNIVKRVDGILASVEQGKGNVGKLLRDEELYKRLNGLASEGEQLLTDVRRGKGTLSRLIYEDTLYQELRSPIQRIDAMLADLQRGQGTAGRLLRDPAVYDDAHASLVQLRALVQNLNAGKGTAGKLLTDEALYAQINQLIARVDATVGKINSGQGTLGQLVVNPQLYTNLNGALGDVRLLIKDIRANPKKFLSLKLALF
jgi:phospholipid/cholesterol/gamma-HCH transport system substrate-binding protein